MATLKRLSPALSKMAARLVHARHQQEAFEETRLLRLALARLMQRGVGETDLLQVLSHPQWENKLAHRLGDAGMTEFLR